MTDITIDPAFRALIPALSRDERELLEASILADGCRDRLIVWPQNGNLLLIDGHHRHDICTRHGLAFATVVMDFDSREAVEDWIDANQLGRRNLSRDAYTLLLGRRYNRTTKQGARTDLTSGHFDQKLTTAEKLAAAYGVGEATVRRAGVYATAVENLASVDPDLPAKAAAGAAPPRKTVVDAAKLVADEPEAAAEVLAGKATVKQTLVRLAREREAEEVRQALVRDARVRSVRVVQADISDAPISAESLDFIITDPPYSEKHAHLAPKLARFAARALKPGGSLLCMVGQRTLPEWLAALAGELDYVWMISWCARAAGTPSPFVVPLKIMASWKATLWFSRGPITPTWTAFVDAFHVPYEPKFLHPWQQSSGWSDYLVEHLTSPGDLVCDPFAGSGGTLVSARRLGRRYVGFDVDGEAVRTAAQRLALPLGEVAP